MEGVIRRMKWTNCVALGGAAQSGKSSWGKLWNKSESIEFSSGVFWWGKTRVPRVLTERNFFVWFREKREKRTGKKKRYFPVRVSAWTSKVHQCDFILIAQWLLILIKASE